MGEDSTCRELIRDEVVENLRTFDPLSLIAHGKLGQEAKLDSVDTGDDTVGNWCGGSCRIWEIHLVLVFCEAVD